MVKKLLIILFSLLFVSCASRHKLPANIPVTTFNYTYQWTCSWDNTNRTDSLIIYAPTGKGPYPLMVFHRGRGFDYGNYSDVFTKISASGVIVTSVSDDISFTALTYNHSLPNYDTFEAGLGMESASYAQIESLNQVTTMNNDPHSPLFNKVDTTSVYIAGHSRGGGATSFSQSRQNSWAPMAKGFIYYMPFDVTILAFISLPPLAPTPALVFAATLDGNLGYAMTSSITHIFTGPNQVVTIQGGTHDYIGDFNDWNGVGTITRQEEHDIIVQNTLNFIK